MNLCNWVLQGVFSLSLAVVAFTLGSARQVSAHCDGLDGPVVAAARTALESKNVDSILVWVQPEDETMIREAFAKTLAVRELGPEARDLADLYLFETLVRVHRAGEGAPYTGLKPAGRDLGSAIPAADMAAESGELEPGSRLLLEDVRHGLGEKFARLAQLRPHHEHDVTAGREFVHAYVEFLHYVEGLHLAATGVGSDHAPQDAAGHDSEGHEEPEPHQH
ncbi:MAG: DUF6448 family protein [Candidatus Zixiibacteriota bacterium]